METQNKITVETAVNAPIETVWEFWTMPEHIINWNNASEDWYTPRAETNLWPEGKFLFRMEAKDGSVGFDFEGIYDAVKNNELIEYTIADGRKVKVTFSAHENTTSVVEEFEAENTNSLELQQGGWQAILNSFKNYTEAKL